MSENNDPYTAIYATLSEYFDCCTLVGYKIDDKKRVAINHWENPQQQDALKTFMEYHLQEDFQLPQRVKIEGSELDERDG